MTNVHQGLYYNARWYDPYLKQFSSPDSLIPDPYNSLDYNRYAYARSNPIRYNDPSGHIVSCEIDEDCKEVRRTDKLSFDEAYKEAFSKYGVTLNRTWSKNNKIAILLGIWRVGKKFASDRGNGEAAPEAFKAVYGSVTFTWENNAGMCGNTPVSSGGCTDSRDSIRFWSLSGHGTNDMSRMVKNVVHELAHAYDNSLGYYEGDQWIRRSTGMTHTRDVLRPNLDENGHDAPARWDWQQSPLDDDNEVYADMFIAWTYDAWNTDPVNADAVAAAQAWMP